MRGASPVVMLRVRPELLARLDEAIARENRHRNRGRQIYFVKQTTRSSWLTKAILERLAKLDRGRLPKAAAKCMTIADRRT
jgi:hypothetical protein